MKKYLPPDVYDFLFDCVPVFDKAADFIRYDVVEEELDTMSKRVIKLLQKYHEDDKIKVLKGKIKLIEEEFTWRSGNRSPVIKIGGEYLDNILLQFPHKVMTEGLDMYNTVLKGKYKITITRIK